MTDPMSGPPSYTTRRAPRARARQHPVATTPSPFALPPTRTAAFVLEVLDAVGAVVVSEAWWTRRNMSLTATPTNEVACEGENEVVTIDIGVVPVIVSKIPVIICPPIVHVPNTVPISPSG